MNAKRKLYIAAAVLIVLVVALGLLTACTSESLVAYEAPAVGTAPTTYTLTVQASKGEAVTRALILNDENTPQESLDAVWMKSETIDVYKGDTKVGELKPQEDNVSQTMLKGEVSNVAVNDVLTLEFLSPSYANQDGTLDYIAAHCDYATASVTVQSINGTDITTTGADFVNQQAIVKFTIENNFTATEMMVVADGNSYAIHSATAVGEFFVALPSFSEKDIQVTAANGSDIYTFVKEDITIASGKYYTLTMQMNKVEERLVDLSTLTGNYTAQTGDILTGSIDKTYKISIADGAFVTLSDASINADGVYSGDTDWAGITCEGNATITLVGTNVVKASADNYPGIQAGGTDTTLTINGTGSLSATGGTFAAGIGSGKEGSCGDISISGGTITATCGNYAAGIGSGKDGSCGNITISGTASGSAKGGNDSSYDIGPGEGGTCGTVSVQPNTISGYWGQQFVAITTFTVKFYETYNENGNVVTCQPANGYNANASTIKVKIGSQEYTATGTYQNGSTVSIGLPVGTNLTLTITSPDTEYRDNNIINPTANFSATLTDVRITKNGENNLGTVNLVRQ